MLYRAIVTLAFVTAFQTTIMMVWLIWRERGEITRVLQAWRIASLVGLSSMAGSLCWFTAFTLQTVAYVNALGQIELLFSVIVGAFVFGEKISRARMAGAFIAHRQHRFAGACDLKRARAAQTMHQKALVIIGEKRHAFGRACMGQMGFQFRQDDLSDERQIKLAGLCQRDPLQM